MRKVKYPENIVLKKQLKRGDLKLIAKASHKSEELIKKVFSGTRKMKPEVKKVYDIVVRFNSQRESILLTDKNQIYKNGTANYDKALKKDNQSGKKDD